MTDDGGQLTPANTQLIFCTTSSATCTPASSTPIFGTSIGSGWFECWYWFLGFMVLGGALMANAFLSFAATNELRISVMKIGPTEMRACFILLNTSLILLGTGWVDKLLPLAAASLVVVLVWVVFQTQKRIWGIDMEYKKKRV
jgi:hypothetical protein